MLRNILPSSVLVQFHDFPCGAFRRTVPVLQAESDETPLSFAATFGGGGCRAVPQFGFVLGSFLRKTTLPTRYFGALFPIFGSFFAKRTQLSFFPIHSWRNSSTFFSWVRLVKSAFL